MGPVIKGSPETWASQTWINKGGVDFGLRMCEEVESGRMRQKTRARVLQASGIAGRELTITVNISLCMSRTGQHVVWSKFQSQDSGLSSAV
jgi:hypothetical protein